MRLPAPPKKKYTGYVPDIITFIGLGKNVVYNGIDFKDRLRWVF